MPWLTFDFDIETQYQSGEVCHAVFSPDDILLAVARNDDCIDIFDIRFVKNAQPVVRLAHQRTLSEDQYGIVDVYWGLPHHKFATNWRTLVTGGSDGKDYRFQPVKELQG
jgi:hypothetical protein